MTMKNQTIQQLADQIYECPNCIPKIGGGWELCWKHRVAIAKEKFKLKRKKSLTDRSD